MSSVAAPMVFTNGHIILPDRVVSDGMIIVVDGMLDYVGPTHNRLPDNATIVDSCGDLLAPGFVDLHVHGGDGADFMDGSIASILKAIRCHARHGTTTIFPTTTTGSPDQIESMLQATAKVRSTWQPLLGARIAGVHLYGPFFAPDKVGCHLPEGRRDPSSEEYRRYFESKQIKIATCAAELDGALDFYRTAKEHQCLITCGHSNSTWNEMQSAFDAGMRHVDHFWCAMSSVNSLRSRLGTPMQASMEQFVLAIQDMSTEVIADGSHLSNELLRFAYLMKGANRLCLVTDSSRALDMPPGRYRFGNEDDGTWFVHDGYVGRTLDGTGLASSTSGMDHMVRTMANATAAPLHETIRMASLTPAERAGIADECGSLEVGKRADIVLLSSSIMIKRVFIQGHELHI